MNFKRVLGYFANYMAEKWPLPQSSRGGGIAPAPFESAPVCAQRVLFRFSEAAGTRVG